MNGRVVSVNLSLEKGTIKEPADRIVLNERGVAGDAHAGAWHRQVSLLSQEQIVAFSAGAGREIRPGEFAENFTLSGLDLRQVAVLDRFLINPSSGSPVELEVTQIGKECHGDACAIFREMGTCLMPKEGLFARVVRGGEVRAGDEAAWLPRPFKLTVLTLSDRAFSGQYQDKSGPRAVNILEEFFARRRWHLQLETGLLPDEAEVLATRLEAARDQGADVILTLGSTGVGPRDIAPEVVSRLLDKPLPGIMEAIRLKFGQKNLNALLSRSLAGVWGQTQVYALPGSVRAVEEYLGEILRTLEHLVLMIHGIDAH